MMCLLKPKRLKFGIGFENIYIYIRCMLTLWNDLIGHIFRAGYAPV